MSNLIIFDCDSTLSALEGIDELARLRGDEVFRASEAMTRDAMDGHVSIESIFGKRLELIAPTRDEFRAMGEQYLATLAPGSLETITALKRSGWTTAILSAGLLPAVQPVGDFLGITEIQAVAIYFETDGRFRDFDRDFPATRSGGKPLVVKKLKEKYQPARTVMVGDGVSDLETKPEVDLFVGFGGFVERPKVKAGADRWITSMSELIPLLQA